MVLPAVPAHGGYTSCSAMLYRAAKTLVFIRDEGQMIGFNYLSRSNFACSHDLLAFLAMIDDWTSVEDILERVPTMAGDDLVGQLKDLVAVSAIVEEGSDLARREALYQSSWRWGLPAALFHHSVEDRPYMSLDESETMQRDKLTASAPPALYRRQGSQPIKLPLDWPDDGLLELMARRRTIRSAGALSVTLEQLGECLFAGLGITATTTNAAGVELPLGMTPSGGARNPYEAFVAARSVEGLPPGFYHYSAFDHALTRVETNESPDIAALIGGQDWADDMPCAVLLVADFGRSMWKYEDANAYRVVLIEAGHIGQNIMLAATNHRLSACPTAALDHALIRRCLRFEDHVTHAPIYALTLAQPGAADPVKHVRSQLPLEPCPEHLPGTSGSS